jgi:hypothetical protein
MVCETVETVVVNRKKEAPIVKPHPKDFDQSFAMTLITYGVPRQQRRSPITNTVRCVVSHATKKKNVTAYFLDGVKGCPISEDMFLSLAASWQAEEILIPFTVWLTQRGLERDCGVMLKSIKTSSIFEVQGPYPLFKFDDVKVRKRRGRYLVADGNTVNKYHIWS